MVGGGFHDVRIPVRLRLFFDEEKIPGKKLAF